MMKTVELMVGSTNYASVVLTLLVLLTPVKYGLFCLHRGASGWFFLLGGMLSFYWKVVPASPSDSYRLVSSFFVSNKIVVLFLALLSTIRSGWIGLLEGIIGFAIGYFVTPSLERPRPLIRCPAFIVSSLTSLFSANIPPQQYAHQPSRRAPQQEYNHRGDYETEVVADEEKVQELMMMGFDRSKVENALKKTLNDTNAAANILLNE
ncbi:hypothetical protein WA577_002798 [Blastocystis sp. JDR]